MNAVELIERKRDGGRLESDEIQWLISSYTSGAVADYQMAAMAMAIFLNGLDAEELADWTEAMLHSGDVLDFSDVDAPKSDKHSTGGVGDKVSIPLGPMVATCGVAIPMMSGRGLGHTGGTLDKLESIPGFKTDLDPARFRSILSKTGLVLAGQSETLVPADRKLYALRDASGTVASIPLIASSIMSKKLAEGLDSLVLDVKFGSGAFMTDIADARRLAETMVGIGSKHGVETIALLTDMNTPLGNEVGNANEIRESLAVLRGEGPEDLTRVTLALGAQMLLASGIADNTDEAEALLVDSVDSGRAMEKLRDVIAAQGGDPGVIDDESLLPSTGKYEEISAPEDGYVGTCDARTIGVAAMRLGAGRSRKEDTIDPAVGITLLAKPGDRVSKGDPLARIEYRHQARLDEALRLLANAWTITEEPPDTPDLILDRIT